MQNREELWQKGHSRSQIMTCRKRGKNIIFGKREFSDQNIDPCVCCNNTILINIVLNLCPTPEDGVGVPVGSFIGNKLFLHLKKL